jgi:hypothetical protein
MLMDRIPPAQLNDYKNQLHEAYRYAICRGEWSKSGHRVKRDRVGKNRKYKLI